MVTMILRTLEWAFSQNIRFNNLDAHWVTQLRAVSVRQLTQKLRWGVATIIVSCLQHKNVLLLWKYRCMTWLLTDMTQINCIKSIIRTEGATIMKNCDPFVFGPALAMLTVYGRSCRSDGWNSSSNSPPQILSPPVPLPDQAHSDQLHDIHTQNLAHKIAQRLTAVLRANQDRTFGVSGTDSLRAGWPSCLLTNIARLEALTLISGLTLFFFHPPPDWWWKKHLSL